MKTFFLVSIIILSIIIFGCSEETLQENENQLIVVSAFLYAGQPVDDINITSTLMLGSEDTLAPAISNASVTLIKNNTEYILEPNTDKAGYYLYNGNDLIVEPNDNFSIEVEYSNQSISSETVVPKTPTNLVISSEILEMPELNIENIRNGGLNQDDYSLLVSWENLDLTLYYVVIENLEDDPNSIFGDLNFSRARRFTSTPTPTNEYLINMRTITHFGLHQAIIYKVNQEYADLYESREQDSRNLNEPLSNIKNGLGVFSAFASDTVKFNIIKE